MIIKKKDENNVEINNLVLESERCMVSNRAAAAIRNTALIDFGIITSAESDRIVDHLKVWGVRQKIRQSLLKQFLCNKRIKN